VDLYPDFTIRFVHVYLPDEVSVESDHDQTRRYFLVYAQPWNRDKLLGLEIFPRGRRDK
jgi:hypothetical protein